MQVLVLGRPGVDRTRLEAFLTDAGHGFDICHDRDWGCVGIDNGCPIEGAPVDVAVAVVEPGDRFDAQGITCAYRARIPIVTIGATRDDPVLRLATTNIPSIGLSVLEALEAAASDGSAHRRAIELALHDRCSPEERVGVSVERQGDRLSVLLVTDADPTRAAALADAARGAARDYDRTASVIDVSVTRP